MGENGKMDMQNRDDDFYRFKAHLFMGMKNILSMEQMQKLNGVLDDVFSNVSIHYNRKKQER